MDHKAVVDLLLETASLKRLPRSGWLLRGVPQAESVAGHSFGVAFVALILADLEGGLDLAKVLSMALLHDLAEVRLTDLPASATHLLPDGLKSQAEAQALTDLLTPLPHSHRWLALWQEFEDRSSAEGRLVRDADKLEMMVQCLRYEQAGSRGLDEFWQAMDGYQWHSALCAGLYARLRAMRPQAAPAAEG